MAYPVSQKSQGAAMIKTFRASLAVIFFCFVLALFMRSTTPRLELLFTLGLLGALVSGVTLLWRRYAAPGARRSRQQ